MSLDLTVAVASHKPYWMPDADCYQPVWTGSALWEGEAPAGWVRDDSYEQSISRKNASYCELTALHWLWRCTTSEYVGLAHYRRHFAHSKVGPAKRRVATAADFESRLADVPLVLPRPRDYVIETNYSQYAHAHHETDLEVTRDVLAERYPQVAVAWDDYMIRTWGHRFNMLVARRDVFDRWCAFVFDVLAEIEQRIDISDYSAYDRRVFGFLSERLLDPWVEANEIPYVQMPVVNMESQHWPRKIGSFIQRKMRAK